MPKREPEPKKDSIPLDRDFMLDVRYEAHRSGVPVAEVMRNFLATIDQDVPSLSMDGSVAVAPDFDAELAGLLKYEEAKDRHARESGDDQ